MYASNPNTAACIRTSATRMKYNHLNMMYLRFIRRGLFTSDLSAEFLADALLNLIHDCLNLLVIQSFILVL